MARPLKPSTRWAIAVLVGLANLPVPCAGGIDPFVNFADWSLQDTFPSPDEVEAWSDLRGNVSSFSDDIVDGWRQVGKGLEGDIKTATGAYAKVMDNTNRVISDTAIAQGSAQAKVRAWETYGDKGTAQTGCKESSSIAPGISAGNAARRTYQGGRTASVKQYARAATKPEESVRTLAALTDTEVDNENLNPASGTLTADGVDANDKLTKTLINPAPPAKLPASVKDTALGQRYEALKRLHETFLLQAEAAQAQVNSEVQPLYELGDWARDAWTLAGHSVDPPGLVDGKMSYIALLRLLAHSRIESPNWYMDAMYGKNSEWQAREKTLLLATRLNAAVERLELLRHLVALKAQNRTTQINQKLGADLAKSRSQALAQ